MHGERVPRQVKKAIARGVTDPKVQLGLVEDPTRDPANPGAPSLLDGMRGIDRIYRIGLAHAMGATKKLAAIRGRMSYDTYREYEVLGEAQFNLLDDHAKDLLDQAAEAFILTGPGVDYRRSQLALMPEPAWPRAAKMFAVIQAADDIFLGSALADIRNSGKGSGLMALKQLRSRFPGMYEEVSETDMAPGDEQRQGATQEIITTELQLPRNGNELRADAEVSAAAKPQPKRLRKV